GHQMPANAPQSAADTETSELDWIHAEDQPLPGAVFCSGWAVLSYFQHSATFLASGATDVLLPAAPVQVITHIWVQTNGRGPPTRSRWVEKPPAQSNRAVALKMGATAL